MMKVRSVKRRTMERMRSSVVIPLTFVCNQAHLPAVMRALINAPNILREYFRQQGSKG